MTLLEQHLPDRTMIRNLFLVICYIRNNTIGKFNPIRCIQSDWCCKYAIWNSGRNLSIIIQIVKSRRNIMYVIDKTTISHLNIYIPYFWKPAYFIRFKIDCGLRGCSMNRACSTSFKKRILNNNISGRNCHSISTCIPYFQIIY